MRADRLIAILMLLQNKGKLSSRELAGELEVSERTIHRDMEALAAAGVPVWAERGQEGGWRLPDGYRNRIQPMKPKEIRALLAAVDLRLLGELGALEDFHTAERKLGFSSAPAEAGQAEPQDTIHIDGDGWKPGQRDSVPLLGLLRRAVETCRKLRITYSKPEGTKTDIVEPLGLVAKRGIWYLVAVRDGERRTFRASRIVEAEPLDVTFERPRDFDLAAYWEQSSTAFRAALPRIPAVFRFRPHLRDPLERERYLTVESARTAEAGWQEALVLVQSMESAARIALSYGPDLLVAAPPELRERVARAAADTAELYCRE